MDVNAAANSGLTALMAASRYGHVEVVRLLLEAGANVNAANNGRTALQMANEMGYEGIAKIMTIYELASSSTAQVHNKRKYFEDILGDGYIAYRMENKMLKDKVASGMKEIDKEVNIPVDLHEYIKISEKSKREEEMHRRYLASKEKS